MQATRPRQGVTWLQPLHHALSRGVTWCFAAFLTMAVLATSVAPAGDVSGSAAAAVTTTVTLHRLDDVVSTVVSGHDVRENKPAPDCYQLAMQRLGVEPAHCIAVEDTQSGLAAAVAANIPCLAVSSPMTKDHDLRLATAVLEDLAGVREWISSHFDLGP